MDNLSCPSEIIDKINSNIAIDANGCHLWNLCESNGNPTIIWTTEDWKYVNVDIRRWVWVHHNYKIDPCVTITQGPDCHYRCCNIDHLLRKE